ncbi:hypothetical protein [Tautonia plasticadhaerens]|uniref:Uncharacterized protein n=1 Tax=Tautonia plasticadhaerens TaxID=2527974 RepID=A0A518HAR5_9BACT|nr:hypothetical protein [Tautonia plasticadhaerens]QDV37942.1 hypothetical protein ElP_58890 [Tautonia plasticadhaerens]
MIAGPSPIVVGFVAASLAIGAALVLVGRRGIGRGDFEIRLGPGDRVEVRGRIPRSKVPGIRGFFRDQPGGVPRGRVVGRFGPGGTPTLRFSGGIGAGLRQRTRNFLIEHLR